MFMVGDFTIYCDESYSHPPDPLVYTVGGYLSTDVQWKKFRKEWRRILDTEGIQCFHMVEFQSCKPPYDSWSKEKRATFLASLHAVIHKRTLMSFATTVDVGQFRKLTSQQQRKLVNAHVFAAKNCMKQVGLWAAENIINHPVIAYVFENGPEDRRLNHLVDSLTDEDRWYFRMASLTFAPKTLNPLQSADVVAYEATKEISRTLDPLTQRKARKSALNLAGDRERNQWLYCGTQQFIRTLSDAKIRSKDHADRHPFLKAKGDET
jgi:hypothetical protein